MLIGGLALLPLRLVAAGVRRLCRRPRDPGPRLGVCPACSTTVFESDPHLRYRGDVYHAEPCVERGIGGPAALRYRRLH